MTDLLLEATGLVKSFPAHKNLLGRTTRRHHAVRGVDLTVARGETLAVVGESGAGKSTLGRLVLRLIEPDAGRVLLDGVDVLSLKSRQLRGLRKRIQMIFQDPYSSLDPRMVVEDAVGEPLAIHFGLKGAARRTRVLELLARVGIGEHQAERYPYEFSGGQLQRIAIARALAVEPDLIVCDEPVAALDVSIRAQVIRLLDDLQHERGVAYIFVSHDLSLVGAIADRVAVMYQGRIVEEGVTATLFEKPRHPYTQALLDAVPMANPRSGAARPQSAKRSADGQAGAPSAGCAYALRCPAAIDVCRSHEPELAPVADGTKVSCHVVATRPAPGRLRR